MKFALTALALALTTGSAWADEMDDAVTKARSCFESAGEPAACHDVFGRCDPVWGYDRRRGCAESIAAAWEELLKSFWNELEPVVVAYDAANNRENDPPLWQAMQLEQRSWRVFRDASCAIDLTGEYIVTGREEEKADCQTTLTQARVEQIYQRILWMQGYVEDYR
jgi:Lysozyme inhibitor LprI